MIAPGVPGKHFMQAAFMVEDLETAAMNWVGTTGIGPFLLVPHIELVEYDYRGVKSAGLDFSVALAQSGGIQIELIQQHCDSPSAYRDTIAKGQQGFHHLAVYCEDYDADYRRYIDTSKAIGCMIELVEESPVQSEFFARVAAEAEGWDGVTDPLRPGFPS